MNFLILSRPTESSNESSIVVYCELYTRSTGLTRVLQEFCRVASCLIWLSMKFYQSFTRASGMRVWDLFLSFLLIRGAAEQLV